jgi:cytidylate kinase
MACKVVCISRALGAGGEEVGRLVAERLGFACVDEEVVARAAARGGVDPQAVADEERQKSRAARVLEALALSGGIGIAPVPPIAGPEELSSEEIRTLIRETIDQMAAQGNVVIVAHAASHALPGRPDVLRVLVTASPEVRAKRIGDSEGVDPAGAVRVLKESDAARRDYLRRFYDLKEETPMQYDLVLNTDFLSVDQAAQLIAVATSGSRS